jgi:calcineurin-like phosphoesterase family protein
MPMILDKELDSVFFTSDQHFGHENIIRYCDRPFASVETMDREMIHRWNEVVGPKDIVFHLGDFTLGDWSMAHKYFSKLTGYIKVLSYPWHHDRRWLEDAEFDFRIELLPPMVVLEIPGLGKDGHPLAITMCHYPVAVWDRRHYGAWHLHGHSHGRHDSSAHSLDVGVDCHDFRPVSLTEIMSIFEEKEAVDENV